MGVLDCGNHCFVLGFCNKSNQKNRKQLLLDLVTQDRVTYLFHFWFQKCQGFIKIPSGKIKK